MIVVLGAMRTGASLVARMLHNLGVVMGSSQPMPWPGFWQDDYEDMGLAVRIAPAFESGKRPAVIDLQSYIDDRRSKYQRMRKLYGTQIQSYGVRSIFLPFYWEEWLEACSSMHERLRLVICRRDPEAMTESLRRCAEAVVPHYRESWLSSVLAKNEELVKRVEQIATSAPVTCSVEFGSAIPEHLCKELNLAMTAHARDGVR